ncbi:MAG: hypothetical protein BWY65_01701 [Firmicutes bacterium ADurb.Bin373]|nr:MAG: hypothetical protein BWY65_01701 [Firmicutes bacterium ADurb.Bin373]
MREYLQGAYGGYAGYQLQVYGKEEGYKEVLVVPGMENISLPLFGVTSAFRKAFLSAFSSMDEKEIDPPKVVESAMSTFKENLNIKPQAGFVEGIPAEWLDNVLFPGHSEEPLQFNGFDVKHPYYRARAFNLEYLCVLKAVQTWLILRRNVKEISKRTGIDKWFKGKYLLPSRAYCDALDLLGGSECDLLIPVLLPQVDADNVPLLRLFECALLRGKQVHSDLMGIEALTEKKAKSTLKDAYSKKDIRFTQTTKRHVLSRLYSSRQGLLPLVWAEIMYAVEHDINAGFCEVCGSVFQLNVSNKKVCSDECTRAKKRKRRDMLDPEYRSKYESLSANKKRATTKAEKDKFDAMLKQLNKKFKGKKYIK